MAKFGWLIMMMSPCVLARKRVHSPQKARHVSDIPLSQPGLRTPPTELAKEVYDEQHATTHLVRDLPGMPFGYTHAMYAGEVSVEEPRLRNNGSLFYWLVESQHHPEKEPLVMWLNGGPGCSSLEGLLIETGPFLTVNSGYDLELNAYAWNRNANVVYLDQPVGTGFAHARDNAYAQSQEEVNIMFMAFLRRWMTMFPAYRSRPLYLAGESYAGRYIPHFAHQILSNGEFNIQGVMIGNGWTHPMIQSESLPQFSFNMGLVTAQQKSYLDLLVSRCRAKWDADPYAPQTYEECEKIQSVLPEMTGTSQIGKVNIYDVRLYDTTAGGEWPWRTTGEKGYLNRRDVQKALHVVSTSHWDECSDEVSDHLSHEDMYPTVQELQDLLPHMHVLIYNGQFDWICNHLGVERFLDNMTFEGKERFIDERLRGLWVSGSRLAGYVKQGGNLTFVTVLGGSHMVPMDKRPETVDLLARFLHGKDSRKTFNDLLSGDPHDGKPVDLRTAVAEAREGIFGGSYLDVQQEPIVEAELSPLTVHPIAPFVLLPSQENSSQFTRIELLPSVVLILLGGLMSLSMRALVLRAWRFQQHAHAGGDRYAQIPE